MRRFTTLSGVLPFVLLGCGGALPDNTKSDQDPQRTIVKQVDGVVFEQEDGVEGAVWLEVPRGDGTTIGGYLSQNDPTQQAVVILLHGASTFSVDGSLGSARGFRQIIGQPFEDAGYLTWSLDVQECGTAYGQGDLDDVLAAIDWLTRKGNALLGVKRVYLFGYSTGGTLAILANRQRHVAAVAAVSGLSEPNVLEDKWLVDHWIAQLFPHNVGTCQLLNTLDTYGFPGSPEWDALDTVAHIDELSSPMVLFHGTEDQIFAAANTLDLQQRYDQAVAAGVQLPVLEFHFVEGAGHFLLLDTPEIADTTLAFFERFTK